MHKDTLYLLVFHLLFLLNLENWNESIADTIYIKDRQIASVQRADPIEPDNFLKNPGLHNTVIFCILIYTVELIPISLEFQAYFE